MLSAYGRRCAHCGHAGRRKIPRMQLEPIIQASAACCRHAGLHCWRRPSPGFGAAALLVAPALRSIRHRRRAQNLSQQAQNVAQPVGFADIVEKVKPAVISVRVKSCGSAPTSNERRTAVPERLADGAVLPALRHAQSDARRAARPRASSRARARASSSRPTAMRSPTTTSSTSADQRRGHDR